MNSPPPRSGPPAAISTPCVLVCFIEPASRLGRGCGWDVEEVAGWAAFSEAERAAIMVELPRRRERLEQAGVERIG